MSKRIMEIAELQKIVFAAQEALGSLAVHHWRDELKVSQEEALAWDNIRKLEMVLDFLDDELLSLRT